MYIRVTHHRKYWCISVCGLPSQNVPTKSCVQSHVKAGPSNSVFSTHAPSFKQEISASSHTDTAPENTGPFKQVSRKFSVHLRKRLTLAVSAGEAFRTFALEVAVGGGAEAAVLARGVGAVVNAFCWNDKIY